MNYVIKVCGEFPCFTININIYVYKATVKKMAHSIFVSKEHKHRSKRFLGTNMKLDSHVKVLVVVFFSTSSNLPKAQWCLPASALISTSVTLWQPHQSGREEQPSRSERSLLFYFIIFCCEKFPYLFSWEFFPASLLSFFFFFFVQCKANIEKYWKPIKHISAQHSM